MPSNNSPVVTPFAATLGPAPSVNPYASAHTLQGFIQLVYLKTANNVLVQSMGSLENSLSVTNSVLGTLTGLQLLKNQLNVNAKGTFNYDYKNDGNNAVDYPKAASAYFGKPVSVLANIIPNAPNAPGTVTQFFTLRKELSSEISALFTLTPAASRSDPTTLYAKLKIVLTDMNNNVGANATSTSGNINGLIGKWIVDNYNQTTGPAAANAGSIQQNLTNAITSGQSLNTTQAESVRNYLYIFQEYYKSAASVLAAINTIIVQMANATKG